MKKFKNINAKAQRRKGAEGEDTSLPRAFAPMPPDRGRLCVKSARSRSAVALVITLIMLAVITFMAVTFLLISHSERNQVSTTTDQNIAGLAADTGLERAKMAILANMLAFTNANSFGVLVSTAYVRSVGFDNHMPAYITATNVNYSYPDGTPLAKNDALQNLANMVYDPPVPVCIVTNKNGANENRLWLDLDRNGMFDRANWPVTGPNGEWYLVDGTPKLPPFQSNIVYITNIVSDPQWVGIWEKSGFPPGLNQLPQRSQFPQYFQTNRAIARFAFLTVPVSDTLDINYLFNQAKPQLGPAQNGYQRDQGVGTWEANLAAFLVDLNTNMWPITNNPSGYQPYQYFTDPTVQSQGAAFYDATAILRYRYSNDFNNLSTVFQMFGNTGAMAFTADGIDGYTGGPLMTNNAPPPEKDNPARPWSGSDNPQHYFTLQELFDPNKTSGGAAAPNNFPSRLAQAGSSVTNSYDRSTFYRLMSQLGTDSAPDPADKMNLNYDNLVQANAQGIRSATNFIPWRPVDFFTNAAIRLLMNAGYTVGSTNPGRFVFPNLLVNRSGTNNIQIMIYPTNLYTPAVHRWFQLAANIYDATVDRSVGPTNLNGPPVPSFPTVFKPLFTKNGSSVFLTGFEEVTNNVDELDPAFITTRDLRDPKDILAISTQYPNSDMIYGIPAVLGAAKGLPTFNEFVNETKLVIARKLLFTRPTIGGPITTNQLYRLYLTNAFRLTGWNSYSNAYPHQLRIIADPQLTGTITNEAGQIVPLQLRSWPIPMAISRIPSTPHPDFLLSTAPNGGYWPPWDHLNPGLTNSFVVPFPYPFNRTNFWPESWWDGAGPGDAFHDLSPQLANGNKFAAPLWWFKLDLRVKFVVIDATQKRILDYVNLDDTIGPFDIFTLMRTNTLDRQLKESRPDFDQPYGKLWSTNRYNTSDPSTPGTAADPTFGIMNQIWLSLNGSTNLTGDPSVAMRQTDVLWPNRAHVEAFRHFLAPKMGRLFTHDTFPTNIFADVTNIESIPVIASVDILPKYQINDPQVHYTVGDLSGNPGDLTVYTAHDGAAVSNLLLSADGVLSERYSPWGGHPTAQSSSTNKWNLAVKDSVALPPVGRSQARSDDWDFPKNKLASIGWLGRVHRGTPWQTVNLKAVNLNPYDTNALAGWSVWTGNQQWMTNFGQIDASLVPLRTNDLSGYTNDALLTATLLTDPSILDVFSTAINNNASQGKMSVNQDGLAAWSAILSGLIVNTNSIGDSWGVIEPAGVNDGGDPTNNTWSPLKQIVDGIWGINWTRTNHPNFKGSFKKLGDVLSVPALTYWNLLQPRSPYLGVGDPAQGGPDTGLPPELRITWNQMTNISDEVYERIPQQILGLLKGPENPRFVIYSYGQALKPADRSIVSSGPFFGMVTNYQITAEVATRAVVRIEGSPDPAVNPTNFPGQPQKWYPPRVIVEKFNVLPPD